MCVYVLLLGGGRRIGVSSQFSCSSWFLCLCGVWIVDGPCIVYVKVQLRAIVDLDSCSTSSFESHCRSHINFPSCHDDDDVGRG